MGKSHRRRINRANSLRSAIPVLLLFISGCSYSCDFEVNGTIRDVDSGQPLRNVEVKVINSEGRAFGDAVTDDSGEFQVKFTRTPSVERRFVGWHVTFSRAEFQPEFIALGPVKEPDRAR